ncbi:hypothetical protein JOF56_009441 [Kibdelosporangium banguiense]|uniref:Uncharacterized protein n=1 Tax=Kibdelosporangium banguiense TaxID=1365924 RepID=A0ABS4TXB2_9PSEU|nr:hypothetical protein [Kibdelosporangium banguiense]
MPKTRSSAARMLVDALALKATTCGRTMVWISA